jgi:Spy/CpxP family protein refolding chaperone
MKRVLMLSALLLLVGGGTMGAKAQDPATAPPDSDLLGPDLAQMGSPGDWGPGYGMQAAGDREMGGRFGRGMHRPGMRGRGHGPRGWGMEGRGEGGFGLRARMAELNLSQDQKDRIAAVHDKTARAMIRSRADLQTARLDMRELLRSDNPDERAIDAQIDKIAAIRADMAKARMGARLEVRSILTPEQRSKLREPRPRGAMRGNDDGAAPRKDRRRQ